MRSSPCVMTGCTSPCHLLCLIVIFVRSPYITSERHTKHVINSLPCPVNTSTTNCHCTASDEIQCTNAKVIPNFLPSERIFEGLYMARQGVRKVLQGAFLNLRTRKIVLNLNPIRGELSESAMLGLGQNLRELYLGGCQLPSLPPGLLSGLSQLTYLHLWANQIRIIPFGFFKTAFSLRELVLWGNVIESVDENTFAGLWNLTRLDLDKNEISMLNKEAFRHLSKLQVLYLGENKIHALFGETFVHMRSLKVLHLDGNKLNFVYEKAFEGLHGLIRLDLGSNEVSHMPDGVFHGLKNVTYVRLSDNQLQYLWKKTFLGLQALNQLHLSKNNLTSLPRGAFSHFTKLRHLLLDENHLHTVQKCTIPRKIKTLSLVGNPLKCDCSLSWIVELTQAPAGTKVWGACGLDSNSSSPSKITSEASYRAHGDVPCSDSDAQQVDC